VLKKHRKKDDGRVRRLTYELTCKSSPREIACVERFLQRINKTLRLDDGTMYRLLVSCTEAVNNAIVHGNKNNPDRRVTIRCTATEKAITIRVKDEGEGFNAENLPDPREEKNLLKESGRGVFLIRSLMDDVAFRRLRRGSVVEMKIKLH
jgi:serine/threonine-protein kinase RsbW